MAEQKRGKNSRDYIEHSEKLFVSQYLPQRLESLVTVWICHLQSQ